MRINGGGKCARGLDGSRNQPGESFLTLFGFLPLFPRGRGSHEIIQLDGLAIRGEGQIRDPPIVTSSKQWHFAVFLLFLLFFFRGFRGG